MFCHRRNILSSILCFHFKIYFLYSVHSVYSFQGERFYFEFLNGLLVDVPDEIIFQEFLNENGVQKLRNFKF